MERDAATVQFVISDELLAKEDFVEIVERFEIEVRDYQEGYEKNKQLSLFDFSD